MVTTVGQKSASHTPAPQWEESSSCPASRFLYLGGSSSLYLPGVERCKDVNSEYMNLLRPDHVTQLQRPPGAAFTELPSQYTITNIRPNQCSENTWAVWAWCVAGRSRARGPPSPWRTGGSWSPGSRSPGPAPSCSRGSPARSPRCTSRCRAAPPASS